MKKYIISCGSTVDLTKEHLEERNIHYLLFTYYVDGVEYKDDFGQTISYEDFYNKIKKGAITKTSQINEAEYCVAYEEYLEQGYDVVCVCLSSGISGTYSSAMMAKEALEERYPGRKVYVIDSLAASSGYGMLVDILADYRDKGFTAQEVVAEAEVLKRKIQHLFFSTDLSTYVRGGRVSKTMGLIGTVLKICPILHVDHQGKLVQYKKVRTKAKAIIQIVEEMYKLTGNNGLYNKKCYISNSNCLEDALLIKKEVEKRFPALKDQVVIYSIGTIIGSHSGPGTCALFFEGDERI